MADGTWPPSELIRTAYQSILQCADENKQATHMNGQPVPLPMKEDEHEELKPPLH
jgi:hypothetical protein